MEAEAAQHVGSPAAEPTENGALKRPADAQQDQGAAADAEHPASKAARLVELEGQAAGEGIQEQPLEEQLAAAKAEGQRWREASESQQQQVELLQRKLALYESLGGSKVGERSEEGVQTDKDAAAAKAQEQAAATIRALQAQLAEANKTADTLRMAAKGHVQKLQQYELQLKQLHNDAQQHRQQQQYWGNQQHRSTGGMLPTPPPPGLAGAPRMPHARGPPQGLGPGAPPAYPPPQAPTPWQGQQGQGHYYGAAQQQQAPQHYDWSWGAAGGAAGAQPPQPGAPTQGGGEYWAGAYQAPGTAAPGGQAAGAAAPPPTHHAPYYSETGSGAADPYTQGAPVAAGAYPLPGAAGAAAAAQPGGAGGPRGSVVDEEQLFWELDSRKREVMERFARAHPLMVDPSRAKDMTITDFKDMTEAQLEGFFMWLTGHCNPSRPLKYPGGFIRVKHTEWKKLYG